GQAEPGAGRRTSERLRGGERLFTVDRPADPCRPKESRHDETPAAAGSDVDLVPSARRHDTGRGERPACADAEAAGKAQKPGKTRGVKSATSSRADRR